MIKTTIYAAVSREDAWEKGEEIGLKGKALTLFRHFNEIELEIELEIEVEEDGSVTKVTVVDTHAKKPCKVHELYYEKTLKCRKCDRVIRSGTIRRSF